MGEVELLSHTADTGFHIQSRTLHDLFETSASAMFSLEYDITRVVGDRSEQITLESDDLEGLMEQWLSELLFLHDARAFAPGSFQVHSVEHLDSKWRLLATSRGSTVDESFEQTGPQIKAVTLHELAVSATDQGFETTVYLDV